MRKPQYRVYGRWSGKEQGKGSSAERQLDMATHRYDDPPRTGSPLGLVSYTAIMLVLMPFAGGWVLLMG